MDILWIVNKLNRTPVGEGEGHFTSSSSELDSGALAVDAAFASWIGEDLERLKPKRG